MVEPLLFPKESLKLWCGVGMDMGSSALKIAYTTEDGDNIKVNFNTFSNDKLDDALAFLKEHVICKLEKDTEIHITGLGSTTNIDKIQHTLNVRLNPVPQLGAVGSFRILFNHQPWHVAFHPHDLLAVEYGSAQAKEFAKLVISGTWKPWPYMSDVEANDVAMRSWKMPEVIKYPVLNNHIGSANAMTLLDSDGSSDMIDVFGNAGGRTFMGLGSIVTGCTDYQELVEMASIGDVRKIDQFMKDLKGLGDEDALYSQVLHSDLKVFPFGHVVAKNKDEFKKEDLAAAILAQMTTAIADQAYKLATIHSVGQVVFTGGFIAHPFIRQQIEKEFVRRRFANRTGHLCTCLFLNHSAHLGSLWTLLSRLQFKPT